MLTQPADQLHLASLHALGLALASDPRDVLVGFIQPVARMGRPVWLQERHFPGALVYAMTRASGTISQVTYQLNPGTGAECQAIMRPDGDWQIPAFPLNEGATTILVTACTADGEQAHKALTVVVPVASED